MRQVGIFGAAVLAVCALAVTSAFAAPPAGTPDPKTVALSATDLPAGLGATSTGAAITKVGAGVVAGYISETTVPKGYGASKYFAIADVVFVGTDAPTAAKIYAEFGHDLSTAKGVQALAAGFAIGAKSPTGKVTRVKPRALGLPDSSMETGIVTTLKGKSVAVSASLLRVDRIIVMQIAGGFAKAISPDADKALLGIVASHASTVLAPVDTAVPAVTGTAQQGQTLTATPGTWSGSPTTYAYQWQSCDASGGNCADVAGATSSTYAVQSTDAGHTLRVTVTATNRFGSVPVESAVTAAVI